MTYISPEEVRHRLRETLGVDFGNDLADVGDRVAETIKFYRVWRNLFVESGPRVDFLNQVEPRFFGFLQRLLFQLVVLYVCRLLDPPTSGTRPARQNLSLRHLGTHLRDPDKAFVSGKLDSIQNVTVRLQAIRSKRIAHNDLDTVRAPQTVDPITASDVELTVAVIADCICYIHREYLDADLDLFHQARSAFELDLLEVLHRGMLHKKAESDFLERATGTDLVEAHFNRTRAPEFIFQPKWTRPKPPGE
ncbi:MAG TPA: hypothetical protein PKD10_05490 [Paracoccaceae bacterium]|nr:hypothetical protein [Paracoccaceae bacterium]HMO72830.1 hypothetical protein [Paracoccaceae bacterium]